MNNSDLFDFSLVVVVTDCLFRGTECEENKHRKVGRIYSMGTKPNCKTPAKINIIGIKNGPNRQPKPTTTTTTGKPPHGSRNQILRVGSVCLLTWFAGWLDRLIGFDGWFVFLVAC